MQRHHTSRRGFLGLLAAGLASPALARGGSPDILSGHAFGTTWRIVGPAGAGLERLRPDLDALFDGIDTDMSPWRPDSAISRFNSSIAGCEAGAELIRVTRAALQLAADSDGAYDPTVGALVARWGFGPIKQGGAPDWRGLRLATGRIAKLREDLTLDLCGIAKGRALDRATRLALVHGLDDFLFDLGGEISAIGHHPAGRDWQVAVEHPMAEQPAPALLQLPAGMAVATSGVGAQSYKLRNRVWGHIMDPATASPVQGRLRSVTVLAADAMTADGWATALFAAGDDNGPALARARDLSALFLFDDGTELRLVETGGIGEVLL